MDRNLLSPALQPFSSSAMTRCVWSLSKTKALVEAIDTNYRKLFPNDGDGPNFRGNVSQTWMDIVEELNQAYTLVAHTIKQAQSKWDNLKRDSRAYNTQKQNDMVRISGGVVREVQDNEIFELVLGVISTYEQEAQDGIGIGGEATGGLGRRVHTITPASARGRRRGRIHTATPEEEDPAMHQAKIRVLDLQAELLRQQIANAQKEGDILAIKTSLLGRRETS